MVLFFSSYNDGWLSIYNKLSDPEYALIVDGGEKPAVKQCASPNRHSRGRHLTSF